MRSLVDGGFAQFMNENGRVFCGEADGHATCQRQANQMVKPPQLNFGRG